MQLALFGATGGTGHQVLLQALGQGHRVRALVRRPERLTMHDEALTLVPGDVLDAAAVEPCVAGAQAVICVLGTRRGEAPIEDRGTAAILAAMARHEVRRLIAVTSLGVGDSRDQVPLYFKLMMKTFLAHIMAAKEEQERLIRASGLDWTLVRPGGLSDGPRTGRYRFGVDRSLRAGRIARADVADFVLEELAEPRFLHQAVAVT